MVMHPIRLYRSNLKLTQSGLADLLKSSDAQVFDLSNTNLGTVSEQWVRRLELGMVNPTTDFTPVAQVLSKKLLERWATLDNAHAQVQNVTNTLWAFGDSLDYSEPLRCDTPSNVLHLNIVRQIEDWYTLKRLAVRKTLESQKDTLVAFMAEPVDICRTISDRLTGRTSEYSFCRALGLHPFTVQTWTRENKTDPDFWPEPVRKALKDVGVL